MSALALVKVPRKVAIAPPTNQSNDSNTAWFQFFYGLMPSLTPMQFLDVGTGAWIRTQLEALGNFGYDSWAKYFCHQIMPVRTFESLKIGETAVKTIVISKWRVFFFALISGDWNPLHFDSEFASKTRFGKPIAHGLGAIAVTSGILGMVLPGRGTFYISQSLKFMRPIRLRDKVIVKLTITGRDQATRQVVLLMEARVDNEVVTAGEAIVGLDEFPHVQKW